MSNIPSSLYGYKIHDKANNLDYRVIYMGKGNVELCHLGITKLQISVVDKNTLIEHLIADEYTIVDEPKRIVDERFLSFSEKELFALKRQFAQAVEKVYGPLWLELINKQRRNKFYEIAESMNISRKNAYRWIVSYIQAGFTEWGLYDHRATSHVGQTYKCVAKSGKKTANNVVRDEYMLQAFAYGKDLYMAKNSKCTTKKDAYTYAMYKYYIDTTQGDGSTALLPASKRPTWWQFRYYLDNCLTLEEIDKVKLDSRVQRNSKRLLQSDSLITADAPMSICEADALDFSVSLIESNEHPVAIGKPTIYAMIDVYSKTIVSVWIAFERDTIVGLTSMLMNIADDKFEYCKQNGFIPSASMHWPTGYLPTVLRVDHGSDFVSTAAADSFNRLGISLELVPPATGSMKGSIERLWKKINAFCSKSLEGNGFNTGDHACHPLKEATFTLDEFRTFVLQTVIAINQTAVDDRPLTADMIAKGIGMTPRDLWNYGVSRFGEPRGIVNKEQFLFDLLIKPATKVSISRKGLSFKGLEYDIKGMSDDAIKLHQLEYKLQNTIADFRNYADVRYDPRNVNEIYFCWPHDTHMVRAQLNLMKTGMLSFKDMTLDEYAAFAKKGSAMKAAATAQKVDMQMATTEAVKEAAQAVLSTKDLAKIRATNKHVATSRSVKRAHTQAKLEDRRQTAMTTHLDGSLPAIAAQDITIPVAALPSPVTDATASSPTKPEQHETDADDKSFDLSQEEAVKLLEGD